VWPVALDFLKPDDIGPFHGSSDSLEVIVQIFAARELNVVGHNTHGSVPLKKLRKLASDKEWFYSSWEKLMLIQYAPKLPVLFQYYNYGFSEVNVDMAI
jgi:hypothetical protein